MTAKRTTKPSSEIEKLSERLREVTYLGTAIAVLQWDQEVTMPKNGANARATTISLLAGLVHRKFLEIDHDGLLSELAKKLEAEKLSQNETTIVRETCRSFVRAKKLPEIFVKDLAQLSSKSQSVWAEAREENNFAKFAPYLAQMIGKKREEAELVGYTNSPYDGLLDSYEPGMTTSEIERIFSDLKSFLVPFIAHIRKSKLSNSARTHTNATSASFPIEKQIEFSKKIAERMGYNFDSGRIDASVHPFTTSFHPADVRITTRYNPKNILESIFPTLHEGGHALYEQGLPAKHFGTPLADAVSLGIHESQSRLWENMVGKSLPFWKHWYPKLQREFPGAFTASLRDFYTSVNTVRSTLVRVEADEVTYNLHIIIRFELEKALIEGTIAVKDLPKLWNERYKEYFGISPKTDKEGVLQDVHWSTGYFGYFPTYTLGNLYSAQFWNTARKQIPQLEQKISRGDMKTLRKWLQKNIHVHGKRYSAEALALEVTGEKLNPIYFSEYLKDKYTEICGDIA